MRFNTIRKMDIANGPGIRVSLFVQGCSFHCKNCFNENTWDFQGGFEFTDSELNHILELLKPNYVRCLSILGGEPLHEKNIETVIKIAKAFKDKYPNKDLWIWSGFLFENVINKDIFNYIDVLVDGRYIDSKHDFRLKWKGSSNQRVIDVKKTLKNNKIVLLEE